MNVDQGTNEAQAVGKPVVGEQPAAPAPLAPTPSSETLLARIAELEEKVEYLWGKTRCGGCGGCQNEAEDTAYECPGYGRDGCMCRCCDDCRSDCARSY